MPKFTVSSKSKKNPKPSTHFKTEIFTQEQQQQRLITLEFWISKRPILFPNINQNGDEDTRLVSKFWQLKVCCWTTSRWIAGAECKRHKAPLLPAHTRTAISSVPEKGQSVLQGSSTSEWDFSRHLLHLDYFEKGAGFFFRLPSYALT